MAEEPRTRRRDGLALLRGIGPVSFKELGITRMPLRGQNKASGSVREGNCPLANTAHCGGFGWARKKKTDLTKKMEYESLSRGREKRKERIHAKRKKRRVSSCLENGAPQYSRSLWPGGKSSAPTSHPLDPRKRGQPKKKERTQNVFNAPISAAHTGSWGKGDQLEQEAEGENETKETDAAPTRREKGGV